MKHPIAESVPVQRLDRHHGLVVVGHSDESEALALVRLQVFDHFHALDGTERAKQLPQHILLRLRCQVVHEDAPAGAVDRVRRQHRVAQDVAGQWREPNRGCIETGELETNETHNVWDTSTTRIRWWRSLLT